MTEIVDTIDTSASAGSCSCCSSTSAASTPAAGDGTAETTDTRYEVSGLTCGHCVSAVTTELSALDEVVGVSVDLVAGGVSTVTVTSTAQLQEAQVAAALDEAGDYTLVGPAS